MQVVDPGGEVVVVAELPEEERDHGEILGRDVGSVVEQGLGHDAAEIEDHGIELATGRDRLGGRLLLSHRLHCA